MDIEKFTDRAKGFLQAVAMHLAGMAALRRSQDPGLPDEAASRLRRDGAGVCRGVAGMAEAIACRRDGGAARQVVRVERVTVEAGGQAVAGAVAPPGGSGEARARGEGGDG